jgi:hypothetical protein
MKEMFNTLKETYTENPKEFWYGITFGICWLVLTYVSLWIFHD